MTGWKAGPWSFYILSWIVDEWTAEVVRLGLPWRGGVFCGPVAGLVFPFPHSVPWGKVRKGVQFMRKRYRRGRIDGSLLVKMRELRKHPTEAEAKLWYHLRRRNLGYRFQRSYTIEGFSADFRCHECRLVVEVDGGQHADDVAYDERRTAKMGEDGYQVIRFWDKQHRWRARGDW
jgi:very-short-patch-repair endonuclease